MISFEICISLSEIILSTPKFKRKRHRKTRNIKNFNNFEKLEDLTCFIGHLFSYLSPLAFLNS